MKFDYTWKVLLFGDSESGKFEIISRWKKENYINMHNPKEKLTIGVDFFVKMVYLENSSYRLQLWDLMEEEKFRFLLPQYISGASGAIIFFSFAKKSTFDDIEKYVQIIRRRAGDIPILLVKTRAELDGSGKDTEDGNNLANQLGLTAYLPVSLKTGINVDKVLPLICDKIRKEAEHRGNLEFGSVLGHVFITCPNCNRAFLINGIVLFNCPFCGVEL